MAYTQPRLCTDCKRIIPADEPYLKKQVEWRKVGAGRTYVRGSVPAYQCEPCAMRDTDWDADALAYIQHAKEQGIDATAMNRPA